MQRGKYRVQHVFYQFKNKGNLLWEYGEAITSLDSIMERTLTISSPLEKTMFLTQALLEKHISLGKPLLRQLLFLRMQNPDYYKPYSLSDSERANFRIELLRQAQEMGEILNPAPAVQLCDASRLMVIGMLVAWSSVPDTPDPVAAHLRSVELLLNVAPKSGATPDKPKTRKKHSCAGCAFFY